MNKPTKKSLIISFEKDANYRRVLKIQGKKGILICPFFKAFDLPDELDLKSIIIDRDEDFVRTISEKAAMNYLSIRGENALTWNVFRTLSITNRWDILFDSPDILTDEKIHTSQSYKNKRPQIYFWNIEPSSLRFNYYLAKVIFYESVSSMGGDWLVEPDFAGFFDDFSVLIESKLKSDFDICNRFEDKQCKSTRECNFFLRHNYGSLSENLTVSPSKNSHCYIYHQLLRNYRMGYNVRPFVDFEGYPFFLISVLNEKSEFYKSQIKMNDKFKNLIGADIKDKKVFIKVTSWQAMRKRLSAILSDMDEKARKKEINLIRLHYYLSRHPDL